MQLWLTEDQYQSFALSYKTKETLHVEKTKYQHLAVVDTEFYGRMLVLDGIVQTTEKDEFVYHEMIAHPALSTHPNPERVLVVGGGDGGAIREIIKHPSVKLARLVEIDEAVVRNAKKYLPSISCALDDPKVEVIIDDGIKHVAEHKDYYDVIIVDSTDPIGPAVGLFQHLFYQSIYEALREDGIFVAQTESPFVNIDLIPDVVAAISNIFPIVKPYIATVPTYPGNLWTFTMGSKKYDPEEVATSRIPELDTKYYTPKLHKACFALPRFAEELAFSKVNK